MREFEFRVQDDAQHVNAFYVYMCYDDDYATNVKIQ